MKENGFKKNSTILYMLIIFAIITIIVFVIKTTDFSFYEDYNRVIPEPDSLKIFELDI